MKIIDIENNAVSELKKLMAKYALTQLSIALYADLHPPRLSEIFANKRRVTADTDLRLCKFFKLKPGHFLKLQIEYDLALKEMLIEDRLDKIRTVDEVIK